MMDAEDVVRIATGEIGYLEKASNSYLDDKTRNAGDKNWTKYSRDLGWGNVYWCQNFVNWCFLKAFGEKPANELLCGMLKSASTMDVKDAFSRAGRLVPLSSARRGDIVFRARNGGGHVGLVSGRTSDGGVVTIEGNTSSTDATAYNGGCVASHSNGSWTWCARPDYSLLKSSRYTPETWYMDKNGWWYAKTEDTFAREEWLTINRHWYYFDERGYAVTGYNMIDGKRYYFETSGDLACSLMRTDESGALVHWEV